jgi:hypothetical protein
MTCTQLKADQQPLEECRDMLKPGDIQIKRITGTTDAHKGPPRLSTRPPSLRYPRYLHATVIVGTGAVRMSGGAPCGRPSSYGSSQYSIANALKRVPTFPRKDSQAENETSIPHE